MLFVLDLECQDWTSAFDEATLTQVLKRGDQWPRAPQARKLTDSEVELPRSLVEFPGFDQGLHERPRYGYSDAWQHFIAARAQRIVAPQSAHSPQSSSTVTGDPPVASFKAPHMPIAFTAPSTLAHGASPFPSFNTPPSIASRAGGPLFRSPAAPFSFTQAPFTSQVRPGFALFPARVPPATCPAGAEARAGETTAGQPTSPARRAQDTNASGSAPARTPMRQPVVLAPQASWTLLLELAAHPASPAAPPLDSNSSSAATTSPLPRPSNSDNAATAVPPSRQSARVHAPPLPSRPPSRQLPRPKPT